MEDLKKAREEHKLFEKRQASFLIDYIKRQRETFEYSDTSMWIAQDTNSEDLILISSAFSEWMLKVKENDPRKKQLENLLLGVFRITSYCQNLETVAKASVSKYIEVDKRNTFLASEIRSIDLRSQQQIGILEKEIKDLKLENQELLDGKI